MAYELRDSSDSFSLWGRLWPWRPALGMEQTITLMKTNKRKIPHSCGNQSLNFHWFELEHDLTLLDRGTIWNTGINGRKRISDRIERETISPWGQWGSGAGCLDSLNRLCPRRRRCRLLLSNLASPKQPGLLWAGGWTRHLLRSLHSLNGSVIIFLNRNVTRTFSADLITNEFTDVKDTGIISLEQLLGRNWIS